jgi:phytoene dehydrogenase-like protein
MRIPIESKTSPEVIVAGAGVSGLLTAALLLKQGKSVHLTEKLPKAGGRLSPELRNGFTLGAGFAFGDSGWWKAVGDRLGIQTPTIPVHNGGALVHGSRGWVTPEELPSWETYLSQPCTEFPVGGAYGIVKSLLDFCASYDKFSFALEAPVTSIEVVDGAVKEVSLGADKKVQPKELHWCADYKFLMEILKGEGVPEAGPARVSWMKKYVKSNAQPGVVLEFGHKAKYAEFTETLLLPFASGDKEERRYLVGSFTSNRDSSLAPATASLSSWILPLTEAEWGDNHESMKKIRSARRLLDKAFPAFDQGLLFDRVLVLESTVSPLAKKKGENQPLLGNLFLSADWSMPHGATPESVAETLLEARSSSSRA